MWCILVLKPWVGPYSNSRKQPQHMLVCFIEQKSQRNRTKESTLKESLRASFRRTSFGRRFLAKSDSIHAVQGTACGQ